EREAETLGRLLAMEKGQEKVCWLTVPRQCEWEFLDLIRSQVPTDGIILSLACGIGVQAMNEHYPDIPTLPALNTKFLGMPVKHGDFVERCLACGDCMLHLTGGICPVARCSKNLMNGPCGGSQNGKCEISNDTECAWQLICDRLLQLGLQDRLDEIQPPKNWSTSRDGGPRRMSREELFIDGQE
ncbi:MAG: methylenetetrahydrofolate reductase C-terminal domain-containing protein, partial [Acidobacteriota bacterium]